ncbi:transketolase [Egicoccus halophilus]|uniref:Transketolase n=2 Tax=Egicoccus halophilus TaxID=1670830 RepID=A0A8J3AB39_9ACTN|nr:transketolase [Egicoccus halophilus]
MTILSPHPGARMSAELAQRSIDTVRTLAMDAVQQANSGHPGMPMGCAPMAYVLFNEVMRLDPTQVDWPDRDRFVLSAGHGSMLLYAALHLAGFARPNLDDLQHFRQWGSPTAGHPENFLLDAVETTTGPLGQGVANGIGMALAAERLAAEFNRPGHEIVDHRVYGIVSDGDLMEGVAAEAASLAGHLRLGRLTYLYDDNAITIDGRTEIAFTEDVLARFDAYGWHTQRVEDVTDLDALRAAIAAADADERPSLIAVRTVIGHGAPNKAGTSKAHGSPLGPDEIAATKQAMGWDLEPFTVPDDVRDHLDLSERGRERREAWEQRFAAYREAHPELADEFERRVVRGELPADWTDALPTLDDKAATRQHSGAVINAIAERVPELFGGSADLAASNNTDVEGGGDFSATDRTGRNVRFGVREHAMASIANGMALHGGVIPYVATFLIFTDYCRPAIRLSALMQQRVVYVMTHDSIGLGEDGPTHQPVEHLPALRAIPGLTVLRPADGAETVAAWKLALEHDGPSVLALTRQGLPPLGDRPEGAVERGAYVLRDVHPDGDEGADPQVVLIGTGSEVQLCLGAAEQLAADGVAARVVSMPSWERFAAQDQAYRDEVLPPQVRARVAVEAAAGFGWERWVGDAGVIVAMERFGASAPAEKLFEVFGFTVEHVTEVARGLLRA